MHWKRWLKVVCGVLLLIPLGVGADGGGPDGGRPFDTPAEKQASPATAHTEYEAGYHYLKAGEYAKAIQSFEKVIKDNPSHAMAYSNLGYSYRQLGQYDRAIALYGKALALQPDLAEAHEYIGEAYLGMGKLEEAKKHLAILETLNPQLANELRTEIARHGKRS